MIVILSISSFFFLFWIFWLLLFSFFCMFFLFTSTFCSHVSLLYFLSSKSSQIFVWSVFILERTCRSTQICQWFGASSCHYLLALEYFHLRLPSVYYSPLLRTFPCSYFSLLLLLFHCFSASFLSIVRLLSTSPAHLRNFASHNGQSTFVHSFSTVNLDHFRFLL